MKYIIFILLLTGCGYQPPLDQCIAEGTKCHDDKEDSANRGLPGEGGLPGPVGPSGESGRDGKDGTPGQDGASCEVTQTPTGATVRCGTTEAVITNGTDGEDGESGITPYTVKEIIDPCGKQAAYDEVLVRMQNNNLLVHFASGSKQFLTTIGPGTYITTDGTSCLFTVHPDMSITW